MNVEEARKIIMEEADCPFGRMAMAAAVLSEPENDEQVSMIDLVACLKRGNTFNKVTAIDEPAALALYRRTGRPRKPGHLPYEDFISDASDWLGYLKQHKLVD